ncbi:MAG: hypothetical protein J7J06_01530 [Methanosarcinales archaeon]|nr:hypothetical protein [Methanosarcinales archaeon]
MMRGEVILVPFPLYDIEVHGMAGIVARARQSGLLSYEETRQVMHDSRTKEVVCT